jgi:N-acetylglucosamine kinase-like BadF-type ATPase
MTKPWVHSSFVIRHSSFVIHTAPMSSPSRILGLEGGGTKTDWVLLESGEGRHAIAAGGKLPASNMRLIDDAQLARLFSVLPAEATHVGVFLAGCATEEDRARLDRLAAAAWPRAQRAIGSDRESGLAAAFGDGDGIAVISGTGAAIHGRKGARIEKAGGWGQLLGDRGGGYDLAMRGLRHVLTHYDLEREISPLAQEILHTLALNRLDDLVGWAMQADKTSVAMLAPAIFRAARFGNAEMLAIIESGAGVLASYTQAVAQRLEFPAPPVQLLGGIFAHQHAAPRRAREPLHRVGRDGRRLARLPHRSSPARPRATLRGAGRLGPR